MNEGSIKKNQKKASPLMKEPLLADNHSEFYRKDLNIEWKLSNSPISYPKAVSFMEKRVKQIIDLNAPECIWLLEHPAIYTAGTSAQSKDLLSPKRFPVYKTGRGGQYTYHGPGQRILYFMLNLGERKQDIRCFVNTLETLIIDSLQEFGIKAHINPDRVGIWIRQTCSKTQIIKEEKIAAIGIRLKKWVSYHGIAINLNPDLTHFSGIIPCGLNQYGVTSLAKLNKSVQLTSMDAIFKKKCQSYFGPLYSNLLSS